MSLKLYEIPQAIEDLIDPETGEIVDVNELERLTERLEGGIEWLALEVKNSLAEAEAMKKEKDAFATRQRIAENRAKSLKNYLSFVLRGQKYKTDRVSISYRRSETVQVDDEFVLWARSEGGDAYLRYKEPEVDKAALKEDLKNGILVPHAMLIENSNIQIK